MYFGFRAQNEQKNHNQPTLVARFHRAGRVSTVRYGTEHSDPACVSTANTTLTW